MAKTILELKNVKKHYSQGSIVTKALDGIDLKINQGEFVMLGSVVETKWLEAGDVAEVEIESLGSVSLRVE